MERTKATVTTVLLWGLILVAVLMLGAVIERSGVTGTCMFVLMPAFAALAAAYPMVRTNRFGTGILLYLPYTLIGFAPLYVFDWLQSHALRGAWAAFAFAAGSLLIGLCMDVAHRLSARLGDRARAVIVGAAMQAATFFVMLAGLTVLYVDPTAADSHLRLFDTSWYFTAPWMVSNGAFGGYAAYALARRA